MQFEITNVLGETRAINQLYANPAYECPFCHYLCTETQCANPACSASKYMTVDVALRLQRATEARAKEEAERKRLHKWAMDEIRQENVERAAKRIAFDNLIREQGGCFKCSDFYRGKVRKHRKECPKA